MKNKINKKITVGVGLLVAAGTVLFGTLMKRKKNK